jgi:AraC-like DNA-binding protein
MSLPEPRYQQRPGSHASVAGVWSFKAGDESRSLVAADGSFDFIVKVKDDERVSALIHKPQPHAHLAFVPSGTHVLGVRLRPGYGAALTDHLHELTQAANRWANTGSDETLALESIVVAAVLDRGEPPDILKEFIEKAVERRGTIRLTSSVSSSRERELQRASRRWLGLTPKAFLRIERARAARTAIRQGRPLAAVAADLSYADQAHLAREVRDLLGAYPCQLRLVGILQDPSR